MKAAWLEKPEGPYSIVIGDSPTPLPAAGELQVRVHAAGVNRFDGYMCHGKLNWLVGSTLPKVLGWEFSGEVSALGPDCHRFAVGDLVFGRVAGGRTGAFAEYLVIEEDLVAAKPERLSHVQAASLPMAGLAAWQALVEIADLGPEQKVLVQGGAGAVGCIAIQLARHRGAWVTATCSDRNLYYVIDLGVIRSVDYSRSHFEKRAPKRHVTLDLVSDEMTERSIRNTRPGGIVISLAGTPDPQLLRQSGADLLELAGPRWRHWRLRNLAKRRDVRWKWMLSRADGAQLAEVADLVQAGAIEPQVARIFAFSDLREAVSNATSGRMRGKYVVAIDPSAAVGQSPNPNVLKDSRSLFANGANLL